MRVYTCVILPKTGTVGSTSFLEDILCVIDSALDGCREVNAAVKDNAKLLGVGYIINKQVAVPVHKRGELSSGMVKLYPKLRKALFKYVVANHTYKEEKVCEETDGEDSRARERESLCSSGAALH